MIFLLFSRLPNLLFQDVFQHNRHIIKQKDIQNWGSERPGFIPRELVKLLNPQFHHLCSGHTYLEGGPKKMANA